LNENGMYIDTTDIKVGRESIERGKATLQSLNQKLSQFTSLLKLKVGLILRNLRFS
jgi:exo-beta-1,3-glucanase (GH17 family)